MMHDASSAPPDTRPGPLLLIFSQTFAPDPAAVGQHMTDVALAMAKRGHRVRVYAAQRGYEDPPRYYPVRENMHGVDVRRLRWCSFGKKNMPLRIFGTASFLLQSFMVGLLTPRVHGIFFSTSPPMIGFAAVCLKKLRRIPIAYWAMDLNPDQLIIMGKIKEGGVRARFLEAVNRLILRNSAIIFALDRFMAARLRKRGNFSAPMPVAPPWSHDLAMDMLDHSANPFRNQHGMANKFVFMYSGNHSPANPLKTILDAAVDLRDHPTIQFAFIGGGLGKKEVEAVQAQHALPNIIALPYQPLDQIKYSLSAADVHIVALGENMVGVIHPCKIYGAMAVGRPILFLGPSPSHVRDILDQHAIGWHIDHGDVAGAKRVMLEIAATPPAQLAEMGRRAQAVLRDTMSQQMLCDQLCAGLERALDLPHATAAANELSPSGSDAA